MIFVNSYLRSNFVKLIIAEKPNLCLAIVEWLGSQTKPKTHIEYNNGYIVTWIFGHFLELYDEHEYNSEWKSWLSIANASTST